MMYQRYTGEFLSRGGTAWRAEIWQEANGAFPPSSPLTFDADEAVTIEWEVCDKHEPICGSVATLQLVSPGDRTFADLYTIRPASVRLDLYRSDALYWSGTLDPEFYEEPYERGADYTVSLTFSDFGILDRMKYALHGVQTLRAIIDHALTRCGLHVTATDTVTYCGLKFADGTPATPDRLAVVSDNFTDEDGEVSTLRDVVEGILQPLALRMVQRGGKVWVYDLHSLLTHGTGAEVEWTSDRQTLTTDRVANSVKVSFSAYAKSDALTDVVKFGGKFTGREPVEGIVSNYASGQFLTIYQGTDNAKNGEQNVEDFRLYLSASGTGVESLDTAARYARVFPVCENARETDCIAWRTDVTKGLLHDGTREEGLTNPAVENFPPERVLFTTSATYLPKMPEWGEVEAGSLDSSDCSIGITMEVLLDPRYNPFLKESEWNEQGNYNGMKGHTWVARVPVGIGLYDAAGRALYHVEPQSYSPSLRQFWVWREGAPSPTDRMFLDYGSERDAQEDCGLFGWKKNGRIAPYSERDAKEQPGAPSKGLVIPYPPEGGWLRLTVYRGLYCFDHTEYEDIWMAGIQGANPCKLWIKNGYYQKLRWMLYKAPEVIVYNNLTALTRADLDDIEYCGTLNPDAEEELNIDTIVGTHTEASPTARGLLLRADNHLQLTTLSRAAFTDHPERLLIGTLCSQYARRHIVLTGEAAITHTSGLPIFSERAQGAPRFMIKGEVQNLITDTTEVTYVELTPDEYCADEAPRL